MAKKYLMNHASTISPSPSKARVQALSKIDAMPKYTPRYATCPNPKSADNERAVARVPLPASTVVCHHVATFLGGSLWFRER